ncbi:hypothetical protein [Sphingobacterium allocomposti]|nr:hypothetical protein [Sphingobacterium composti Yoo et al. 2007 non Ten et al. 2007]HLS95572.1 hypothetical protein [Sphingobacterium sp.]
MKTSATNKRLFAILFGALLLLAIPLIAMQFTEEVNWTAFDFLVAGVLLSCTGLLCEGILRLFRKTSTRVVACLTVLFVAFMIWAELAVGIFT